MPAAKTDKAKRRLKNVKVNEISFVHKPAVPDAEFVIVKRLEGPEGLDMGKSKTDSAAKPQEPVVDPKVEKSATETTEVIPEAKPEEKPAEGQQATAETPIEKQEPPAYSLAVAMETASRLLSHASATMQMALDASYILARAVMEQGKIEGQSASIEMGKSLSESIDIELAKAGAVINKSNLDKLVQAHGLLGTVIEAAKPKGGGKEAKEAMDGQMDEDEEEKSKAKAVKKADTNGNGDTISRLNERLKQHELTKAQEAKAEREQAILNAFSRIEQKLDGVSSRQEHLEQQYAQATGKV